MGESAGGAEGGRCGMGLCAQISLTLYNNIQTNCIT